MLFPEVFLSLVRDSDGLEGVLFIFIFYLKILKILFSYF